MTLNASWIERLTLHNQVIRETKGQAKQEEDPQPQLPYRRVPFPPIREGGQMHCGSEPHSPHASAFSAWRCSRRASKMERNEAGEFMGEGWKLTGMFACGNCSAELIQLRWTWIENWQQSDVSIRPSLLEEADRRLKSPLWKQMMGRWWLFSCTFTTEEEHARQHTSGPPNYFKYESLCFLWTCRNLKQFPLK